MHGQRAQKARVALKHLAGGIDRLVPHPRGITVLIYHRVGRRADIEMDLPLPLFREQMAWLAAHRRVVPLDEALAQVADPDAPTRGRSDPVVLTFDDGTADFTDQAAPVLHDLGLPATLYLATQPVDEQEPLEYDGRPPSWSALRDVQAAGLVQIGSHTHSHLLLDRVDAASAEAEIRRSCELIEQHLGVRPVHFAYPRALLGSPEVAAVVQRHFRSAALAGTRANRYGHTDPQRLARSPIQASDGMRWFLRKVDGGMGTEDRLRQAVNRLRLHGLQR